MTKELAKALLALYGISGVNHQKTARQASILYFGKTGEQYDTIYSVAVS